VTGELGEDYKRIMKAKIIVASLGFLVGLMSVPAASPFKNVSHNKLLHTPSNVFFPANVALFQRARTHIYGSAGRDVSVRYLLDSLIIGDVYVYPVGTYGKDLTSEFQIQQRSIGQMNKKVKLISQDSVRTDQNRRSIGGLHANYELTRPLFTNSDQRCGSQLYVFRDGAWFVAYRFSYPYNKSPAALNHVAGFLNQWRWKQS
jgi:hypothetical protein